MQQPSTSRSAWSLIRQILAEQRGHWRHLLALLVLGLAATPLSLLAPVGLKLAVDSFVGGEPVPGIFRSLFPESFFASELAVLIFAAAFTVAVAALTQVQALGTTMLKVYTTEKMVLGFRERLFPHVQRLSLSYHDEKGTADSTYRVLYDTAAIPSIIIDGILPLTNAVVTLIAMFVVVFLLSWPLAVIALVIAPLLLLISRPFSRRLRREWHDVKELDTRALSLLQEVLSAVRVVKAFGKEEREKERLIHLATEGMWARIRVFFTKGGFDATIALLTAFGMAGVLFIGMWQVKTEALTLGGLLMAMAYLNQVYGPMQLIMGQAGNLQAAFASAERAMGLLEEAPEVEERPDARPLQRARGEVAFEGVDFWYDADNPVLQGLSFHVEAGTRVGIAGETGAGKTTLINLMTRLYDPVSGRILLDGVDLRDYRVADLRRQFSVVLQEPVLFSKSILENIAYARPTASEEEVEEAARLAGAHDFILKLPDGYRTKVGERGMSISGGERQRVSLARAFLKDAPLLILDEPTSSVDIKTESGILRAFERLMRGRTVFIIAHRPRTLAGCDRVLVVERGRIARFGSPETEIEVESLVLGDGGPGGG